MPEYKNGELVGGGGSGGFSSKVLPEEGGPGAKYFDTDCSNNTTSFFLNPAITSSTGTLSILNTTTSTKQFVAVPDDASLKPASTLTVMADIELTGVVSGEDWYAIVAKSDKGGVGVSSYILLWNKTSKCFEFRVVVDDGSETSVAATGSVAYPHTTSGRCQVTGTFDGSDVKLYVHNVNGNDTATTGHPGVIAYTWGYHTDLMFGRVAKSGSPHYPVHGIYDRVAIWGRALSSTEIAAMWAGSDPNDPAYNADLVSVWHFEEGSGTTIGDSIGSNDGTWNSASGTPTWSAPSVENFTLNNPTNMTALQPLTWTIKNGGSRQIIYDSLFDFDGAATGALTTTAGRTDVIKGVVSSDKAKIYCRIFNDYTG